MENTKENQMIVSCPKCGHEHKYETLEAFEKVSLAIPCNGGGYLFVQRIGPEDGYNDGNASDRFKSNHFTPSGKTY